MRLLLVEDVPSQAEIVKDGVPTGTEVVHALTRDAAFECLEGEVFDITVCDLKIPPAAGAPADVEHGLAVLTAIRERCAGTPIITFTAHKTKEVLDVLLREQRQEDYLGMMQEIPMLRVMEKDELPELLKLLGELSLNFERLQQIEVSVGLGNPPVPGTIERVAQIYARQRDAVVCHVERLTSGHSGVPVVRLRTERSDGSTGPSAVARIARVEAVESERIRFQQRVSGILPLGSYAEITGVVRAGAGGMGGVFYQVAEDAGALWDIPLTDDSRAGAVVGVLREIHQNWIAGVPAETSPIVDIRRLMIDDGRWAESTQRCGIDEDIPGPLEKSLVYTRNGTVHADLHAGNVLVGQDPVLIDFESVSVGPPPLDPVTLELTFLFHPDAPPWEGEWPTEPQMENWGDVDAYVDGCPFPQFVRACRAWTEDVSRGTREIYACAYAYVAGQSRFGTSDEGRLTALMSGFVRELAEN